MFNWVQDRYLMYVSCYSAADGDGGSSNGGGGGVSNSTSGQSTYSRKIL